MNLIHDTIEHAKSVDATSNAPFQSWLAEVVYKEDLHFWATKMEEPVIVMSLPEKIIRPRHYRFLP